MRIPTKLIAKLVLCFMPAIAWAAGKEITVWAWDPNFNIAIMKEAAERYKADHPDVKFKIVDFAKADVEQKLLTNLASGVTKALPDIVLIEDYNAQKYLQSFPGSFADLTKEIDYKNFAPYKVSLMTVNKKVYGIPFDTGVTGLFYRRDILEKAGYSEDDLKDLTWDRFIEIGKAVKEKTGTYMMSLDPNDSGILRIMMHSANSWFFDDKGHPALDSNPVLAESMSTVQKLFASGIVRPSNSWADWVSTFNQGEVATVTTGVWIIGSVKSVADQSGKWGVAPIPKLNIAGATHASNLGGSSWYVMNSSKAKKEAIDFLKTVYAGDTDFYQDILVQHGAVGTYLPSQTGPAYSTKDPFFGGQAEFLSFSEWLKNVPALNFGLYTYEVGDALVAQVPGLLQGGSVEQALKNAQRQAASLVQ
ncbi:ABC transporter substrate-binding protein [Gynuella sunshinyii]|uniref:ABC-type sugar transport system, periplasmic component n=1 Tax=Gynuella sunshinyii YC6258 TaxID=1445510 RepID=A0A0C5V1B1_9GAMM|nr:sugar ABC transporter substrate-binding protein [Gynuella sunshinyii]AJQ93290.1 ABC-type sugar transport system, periplasmic component [Gynuella sunshinyii YC6258]